MCKPSRKFRALETYTKRVNALKYEVQLYEQLYCSEDSCKKLNANLLPVFTVLQKAMFISILTQISAVLDCKGEKNSNLSLDYFIYAHRENITEELLWRYLEIKNNLKALEVKKFRHKCIAHHDLKTTLGDRRVTHSIKSGDFVKLLSNVRNWCVALARCLYGDAQTTVETLPWEWKKGEDGFELVRRLTAGTNESVRPVTRPDVLT